MTKPFSTFREALSLRAAATGLLLSLFATGATPCFAQEDPPQHINVGSLPAREIEGVVIPVPTEVFGVLDKLGSPNWHDVLRQTNTDDLGERPAVALLLGSVIAEGFIAVEAQEPEEVKRIGRQVLKLAGAIDVRKSVIARTNSIVDAADKKDWQRVKVELDGASQDVKTAMEELHDGQLAQLVSLGGWLRGTEAVTQIVSKNYSKDGAELLHQPALLDYFQKRLNEMNGRLGQNELVKKIRERLPELRPLIEQPTGNPERKGDAERRVDEIHNITAGLVKAVAAQKS